MNSASTIPRYQSFHRYLRPLQGKLVVLPSALVEYSKMVSSGDLDQLCRGAGAGTAGAATAGPMLTLLIIYS